MKNPVSLKHQHSLHLNHLDNLLVPLGLEHPITRAIIPSSICGPKYNKRGCEKGARGGRGGETGKLVIRVAGEGMKIEWQRKGVPQGELHITRLGSRSGTTAAMMKNERVQD